MSLRKWNNGPNRLHWPVWPIWPVILFPMWHSVSPPGMFYLISAIHCSMQITTDWRPLSLSSFLFLPRDWCLPCPSAELPWEPFPLLFCHRALYAHARHETDRASSRKDRDHKRSVKEAKKVDLGERPTWALSCSVWGGNKRGIVSLPHEFQTFWIVMSKIWSAWLFSIIRCAPQYFHRLASG